MVDTNEQIAVVQAYIHLRKDKEVQIAQPVTFHQIALLGTAYNIASRWFQDNGVTLEWVN